MGQGTSALATSRLVLMAAFVALSGWTAFVSWALDFNASLLFSLVASTLLFVAAVARRRGGALRVCWAWLGLNFLAAQAVLLPGTSYLIVVSSAAGYLVLYSAANFLDVVFPITAEDVQLDPSQYESTWSVVKRNVGTVALYAILAWALSLAGVELLTPVVLTGNPVLLAGILIAVILVLVAALSTSTGKPSTDSPSS